MSEPAKEDEPAQSSSDARIDSLCDRFEAAWTRGDQLRIEEFLAELAEPERLAALRDLLRVGVEFRRCRGESPTPAEYQQRFAGHRAVVEEVFAPLDNRDIETVAHTPIGKAGDLHVRCPHCHNPIELVADAELREIDCPSCGNSFSISADPAAHDYDPQETHFAHFKLIERLGIGAFGAVWKAQDTQLDRMVAIKIPRKETLGTQETENFLREARAAAQLQHPNIVSVHEIGREGDRVYIVSDLVEGGSLAERLLSGPLTSGEAAELCAKIAEALEHAHQRGVIHRDLKPANILLDTSDNPQIADFGLAKREAAEITMTMEGQVIGTPAYMSPEQAQGDAHDADARSDVYSLGVVLFELLTGELPFRGSVRMLLKQVVEDDAPSLRKLNSHVPKDLETICLKCLEKQPGRRYASAAAMAEDLQRFLRHEPIAARPISTAERTLRLCRRNPAAATAAALLAFVAIAGPLSAVNQSALAVRAREETVRANTEANRAKQSAEREAEAAARARDQEALTRRHLYTSEMNLVQSSFKNNDVRRSKSLLMSQIPREGSADLRGFEWYYWWRQCHSSAGKFALGYPGRFRQSARGIVAEVGPGLLAFSDDGRIVALGQPGMDPPDNASGWLAPNLLSDPSAIHVFDVKNKKRLTTYRKHKGLITALAVAANGKIIASSTSKSAGVDGQSIRVWDAESGDDVVVLYNATDSEPDDLIFDVDLLRFSPDGHMIASVGHSRAVVLWDVGTGKRLSTIPRRGSGYPADVTAVEFSADNEFVAVCRQEDGGEGKGVAVWNVTTGELMFQLDDATSGYADAAFSPNGKLIAAMDGNQRTTVRDIATQEEQAVFEGRPNPTKVFLPGNCCFSQDGQRLAINRGDVVNVWNPNSGDLLSEIKTTAEDVRFSEESGNLLTASIEFDESLGEDYFDCQISSWKIDKALEYTTVVAGSRPAFSGNGRYAACRRPDGVLQLWDVHDNFSQSLVQPVAKSITAISMSADGKSLAAAHQDGTISTWDVAKRSLEKSWRGHWFPATSIAYSPDGKLLATVNPFEPLKIWDIDGGPPPTEIPWDWRSFGGRIAFSRDSKTVSISGVNRYVACYDVKSSEWVRNFDYEDPSDDHSTSALAYSQDGRWLAAGAHNGIVHRWDTTTGKALPPCVVEDRIQSIAFSGDEEWLAIWDGAGVLTRVKVNSKEWVHEKGVQLLDDGRYVAIGGNGAMFAAADTYNNELNVWLESTDDVQVLQSCEVDGLSCMNCAENTNLVALGYDDGRVIVVNANTDETIALTAIESIASARFQVVAEQASQGRLNQAGTRVKLMWNAEADSSPPVSFAPNGQIVAFGQWDGSIVLWDASMKKPSAKLIGHQHPVLYTAFSPDGATLASASPHEPIRLWDMRNEHRQIDINWSNRTEAISADFANREGPGHSSWNYGTLEDAQKEGVTIAMVFCGDGDKLITNTRIWGIGNLLEVRDTTTGETRQTYSNIERFAVSPDGNWLAMRSSSGTVSVHDLRSSAREFPDESSSSNKIIDRSDGIMDRVLKFSPDNRTLLFSRRKGTKFQLIVRSIQTGLEVAVETHCADAAVSPDGRTLATFDGQGMIKLWDPETSAEKAHFEMELVSDDGADNWLSFSPDGSVLAVKTKENGPMALFSAISPRLVADQQLAKSEPKHTVVPEKQPRTRATRNEARPMRNQDELKQEASALLAYKTPAVRKAVRRTQSQNNLEKISLALLAYWAQHSLFPPAVLYDEETGTPYSWRVAILPFMKQKELFKQYDFSQPWDSEKNKAVLESPPGEFLPPTESNSTSSAYFALTGHETVFAGKEGVGLGQLEDGSTNTILVVEAKRDIPWTKPEDIPYSPDEPLPKLGGFFDGGFHAAFFDTHFEFLPDDIEEFFDGDIHAFHAAFCDTHVEFLPDDIEEQKLRQWIEKSHVNGF